MYEIYNNLIQVIKIDDEIIQIYIEDKDFMYIENIEDIQKNSPQKLISYEIKDTILIKVILDNGIRVMIYSANNHIYICKYDINEDYIAENYDIKIENRSKRLYVEQKGVSTLILKDRFGNILNILDDFVTPNPKNITIEYEWNYSYGKRFFVFSKIEYKKYTLIFTYDFDKKEINIFKLISNEIIKNEFIDIEIINRNDIVIINKIDNKREVVKIRGMKKGNYKQLFRGKLYKEFEDKNIICIYAINKARYYIYKRKDGIFISKSSGDKVIGTKANLNVFNGSKNMYIFGSLRHYGHNCFGKFEYLYLRNSETQISEFKRPFKNMRFLQRFGYYKISYDKLDSLKNIHNNLLMGNKQTFISNLFFKQNDKKVKTYSVKKYENNVFIIRTNLQGNITSTILPYTKEYSKIDRVKIKIAQKVSKLVKNKNKNLNLYFEKKASKADESGFRVFEKVKEMDNKNSLNYFILDKSSSVYNQLKRKYGNKIVKKYSFRHYLYIFNADNFISSELSNHVLNDRLFIESLREQIMKTPLTFLQHGIMFAKPVDNPMAFGFHKDKNQYNMKKTVISSELEAGEFYKMNYDREDLILTGLATFDYAKLNTDADKIAFMPTYRYWEEGLIYSNKIEQTTFYKTIIKVIDSFEKAGLIDRLLIVPHNKFSEYIYNNMPQYRNILSNNPSEALKMAKIFITDYSSAIYDAQYRGAYPIFYWEEKDYLISQYKAIPPVNENNAPGPVAKSIDELIEHVKTAIDLNYELNDEYKEKYLKINEFNDGKNTERIVSYLKQENII